MRNVTKNILKSALLFLAAFGFASCYKYVEKIEARDGTDAVSTTIKANPFYTSEEVKRRPYAGINTCVEQHRKQLETNGCTHDTSLQYCEFMGLRDQFLSGGGMGMGLGLAYGGGGINAFGPPTGNVNNMGFMPGLALGTSWSNNNESCVTKEEADIRLGHLKEDLRKRGFEVDREEIRTDKYRRDNGAPPTTETVSTEPKPGA